MRVKSRSRRWLAACVPAAFVACAAAATWGQGAGAPRPVATVGGLRIERAPFEERAKMARAEYERRSGGPAPPAVQSVIDRQVLEFMIRGALVQLEAERKPYPVSDAVIEAEVQKNPVFFVNGRFDPARYRAIKAANPKAYEAAAADIRRRIKAERLTAEIQSRLRPDEARVRARAERALARADLSVLAIKYAELSSTEPEPREADVVAYYHAHAKEYLEPARVVLAAALIDRPEEEGRVAADSLLAEVRAGADLDVAAERFGRVLPEVVVHPDNFPGYWRGNSRLNASIFQLAPGTWISEPVPAAGGWIVARVVQSRPPGPSPLADVSLQIRSGLRAEMRARSEDADLRALYEEMRDTLRGPAFRLRYGVIDSTRIQIPRPSSADLERYYRSHLADYTRYDAASGQLVSQPYGDVESQIRARWLFEQRSVLTRSLADELSHAWGQGRRDRALESGVLVREVGPLPMGASVDTGSVSKALGDALAGKGMRREAGSVAYPRGMIVYHVYETMPNFVPTFELARSYLSKVRQDRRTQSEERRIQQAFERDPLSYANAKVVHISRLFLTVAKPIDVPLTREEIERYHREHIDRYSSGEQIRARHILVTPENDSPEADAAARTKATQILARIRKGEKLETLAAQLSDDDATRDQGGDLGYFGRGTMLPQFEAAAFALEPGQVSDVIRTTSGYHIIQLVDHRLTYAEPLMRVYANVGVDAAHEKAARMARAKADSIFQSVHTVAALRAMAVKYKLPVERYRHRLGDYSSLPASQIPMIKRLESLRPGTLYPRVEFMEGTGAYIQWVDSIGPPEVPLWSEVRGKVLDAERRKANDRAFGAKRAELDSLMRAGWSFDSVGALWGGLRKYGEIVPGKGIPDMASADAIDSLVFGEAGTATLERGVPSGWIDLGTAYGRVRVDRRLPPNATRLATRMESERRLQTEFRSQEYFVELKRRFPVRILDSNLSGVEMPPLPDPDTP